MSASHVAVLTGGLSLEREVSLRSGARVAQALGTAGHRVSTVDLDEHLVERLDADPPDAAVLALHGKSGEDGTIQGMLDVLGIPYTGPGAPTSALVWDKSTCKGVLARGGVDTPAWVALTADAIRDLGAARILDRLRDGLGVPLVVKPSQGGAGMGVTIVQRDLSEALVTALNYHHTAVCERFVEGTEVAVALLDGEALPAVEIVPRNGRYDYAARYTYGATEFFVPARISPDVAAACEGAALAAWELTGCRDIARADLIVDGQGRPWVLELDTCPGMTETSLVPMAASAAGYSFTALCERLLTQALARR